MRLTLCALALVLLLPAPAAHAQEADSRWSAEAEYLWWYLRRDRVPPLLTTSPPASQGVLGREATVVLYDDDGKLESRHGRFVGPRARLAWWGDAEHSWGLEAGGFFLERDSSVFTLKRSPGDPLLARPFIDALTGQQSSEIIAGPVPGLGTLSGGINAYQRVEVFGEEANAVLALADGAGWRVELLAGGKFLQMRDRLDVTTASYLLPDETTLFAVSDHLWTFNKYFGGQLGLRGTYAVGRWSATLNARAGVGVNGQEFDAKAERTFQTPLVKVVSANGLYVQPTNAGHHERWAFDAVAEVGVTLRYQVFDWLGVSAGYNFLYWLNPIRAGDQIDAVNPTQIAGPLVGPAQPRVPFRDDFFWAQGLTVGAELRW